ncbi:phage tail protein [Streptococcus constellatus]|uniref:phage tail protein n=1 Tax=Streptococcus constellatus TaxID=76860 RepID=UPI00200196FB|nr:phage tail protein [Streptococcus constellatus]
MIKYNELVIDGIHTSSFPYKIIILESPKIQVGESKTKLLSHDGISGYIMQSNEHREPIEKTYTIQMVNPTEQQILDFCALLAKRNFWLENEQNKLIRWWCYQVKVSDTEKDKFGVYSLEARFICHPTKYMKKVDNQILSKNGVLVMKGSALAFPKIIITGQSASETTFTVGSQVIRLEKLSESAYMTNNPANPSFLDEQGKPIKWSGDFISLNANQTDKNVGVVLGPGIQSIEFETNWGWI